MTFIKIDSVTYINAEIIALISLERDAKGLLSKLHVTTKNGKEYTIEGEARVYAAAETLGL